MAQDAIGVKGKKKTATSVITTQRRVKELNQRILCTYVCFMVKAVNKMDKPISNFFHVFSVLSHFISLSFLSLICSSRLSLAV